MVHTWEAESIEIDRAASADGRLRLVEASSIAGRVASDGMGEESLLGGRVQQAIWTEKDMR
jgi:hypothetical protein